MKEIVLFISCLILAFSSCAQKNKATTKKEVMHEMIKPENLDTAVLGAGCFWCVEAVFQQLNGVEKVVSGYAGGHIPNPTYEEVCSKQSGHVEVAQIIFDKTKVSFDEVLEVFWKTHDPTTIDQQGNDKGPQYKSAIFYTSDEQKNKAIQYKKELNELGAWDNPIVTVIENLTTFYPAENYHQNYYNNNPDQMYCKYVIQPKVEKFKKVFKDKLKKQ